MAILHNKAGQFCKDEARKRVTYVFFGTATAVAVVGALGMYLCLHRTSWWAAAGGIAALLVMYIGNKCLDKPLDTVARERIKYMRGGQAEALVAWLLADLDDTWHLFNNIKLVADSDIDHVLVGPGGLFCISTKSFRGMFTSQPNGHIYYNNQPTRLISDTIGRAAELNKRLRALMGEGTPYVVAVLAVPFCYEDVRGSAQNVMILHQENMVDTLEKRRRTLSDEQIARCVRALTDLAKHARDTYRRPKQGSAASPKMEAVEPRNMV